MSALVLVNQLETRSWTQETTNVKDTLCLQKKKRKSTTSSVRTNPRIQHTNENLNTKTHQQITVAIR